MEIERKFTVRQLPDGWEQYPCKRIEQGYLCTRPVVRVRRCGEEFWLTCKGEGLLEREEYELPLTEQAYRHLLPKADGLVIQKERFYIPWNGYTIEMDVFDGPLSPLILAEVEFSTRQEALAFQPPAWFDRDVTGEAAYSNSNLSKTAALP
jgi:CYTH domain-containing protein